MINPLAKLKKKSEWWELFDIINNNILELKESVLKETKDEVEKITSDVNKTLEIANESIKQLDEFKKEINKKVSNKADFLHWHDEYETKEIIESKLNQIKKETEKTYSKEWHTHDQYSLDWHTHDQYATKEEVNKKSDKLHTHPEYATSEELKTIKLTPWPKWDDWDDWLSAFEIAVKNWFKWTEKEWLESLKWKDWAPWKDGKMIEVTTRHLKAHQHWVWDIIWLEEKIQDVIWNSLVEWTNITIDYDDITWETTINSTWWAWIVDWDKWDITVSWGWTTRTIDNWVVTESKLNTSVNTSLDLADSSLQSWDNISELVNNSWYTTNTGTVTSVAISGSDWIEIDSGSPVTTTWTIALWVNKTAMLTHLNVEDWAEANNISDVNATDLTDWGNTTLHTHDSRYYTETEVDTLLGLKEPIITAWTINDYYRWDKSFQKLDLSALTDANNDANVNLFIWHKWATHLAVDANYNVGIWPNTMENITSDTASGNVALGAFALNDLTEWWGNFGLGFTALRNVTTGNRNIWIGKASAPNLLSGSDNIAIGENVWAGLTTHSRNILIGDTNTNTDATDDYLNIWNAIYWDRGTTTTTGTGDADLTVDGSLKVVDEAYDATSWNWNLEVPTKNAIRDKIESMGWWWGWDVFKVWTPVNNQLWVWTWDWTIEWDTDLTFDTTTNTLSTVNIAVSWTVDWRDVATDWTKLDWIESGADVTDATNVAAAWAFMKAVDDTDDITVGATNKFATAAEKTKLWYITVTQAVDLDTMESDIAAKQPLDSDLTTIAWLTATTDNFMQAKAWAWASRTVAQVKTDLWLTWINSWDQTSIVWITWTKAQFDTAVTDGNFLYVWDITQYTDELAQDAVGGILTDSSTIDFTYNDWANTITASVIANSIPLNDLSDVVLTAPSTGQVLKYNWTNWINDTDWGWWGWSSTLSVTQTTHWFSTLDWLYYDESDSTWKKAQSNSLTTLGMWHVVEVVDANNFNVAKEGTHTVANALTKWEYVLSKTTAWLATQTIPSSVWDYVLYWMEVINSTTVSFYPSVAKLIWEAFPTDWRTSAWETRTYASVTTFTISWDLTGKYQKWDRIKLTQTTVKYFVVLKVLHSAWTTTVTITWWTDYTLANAAITSPFFSKQASPQWYPNRFTWTPVHQWFSSAPTISYSQFSILWDTCDMRVSCTANWTSNQTYYYINTPDAIQIVWQHQWWCHYPVNNSATINDCYVSAENTRTYIELRPSADNDNRTASWWKRANVSISFRFTL